MGTYRVSVWNNFILEFSLDKRCFRKVRKTLFSKVRENRDTTLAPWFWPIARPPRRKPKPQFTERTPPLHRCLPTHAMSSTPMLLLAVALAFASGAAAEQILTTDIVDVAYHSGGDSTCTDASQLRLTVSFDLCCPCFRWSFNNDVSSTKIGEYTLGDNDFKWKSHITSDNCVVGTKGVANKHADSKCIKQTEGIAYNCRISKVTHRNGTCAELQAANATVCEQGPFTGDAYVPLAGSDSTGSDTSATNSSAGGSTGGATGGSTGGSSAAKPACASSCTSKPSDCAVFAAGGCATSCTQTVSGRV